MPGLRIALKLELIYGVPVSNLFPEHYNRYRGEIALHISGTNPLPVPNESETERLPNAHICTYDSLLWQRKLSASEVDAARQHTVRLVRHIGEVICRYQPPE